MLSHILVVGFPNEDPEIERALSDPRFDVQFAGETEPALKLVRSLAPSVIVIDLLVPGLDAWRVLSKIFEEAVQRQLQPPAVILLNDQVTRWQAAQLGQVRTTDRAHLRETFKEAADAVEKLQPPTLAAESIWGTVVDQTKLRSAARQRAEQDRLRKGPPKP